MFSIMLMCLFNYTQAQNTEKIARPASQEAVREVPVKIFHFDEMKQSEDKKEQTGKNQIQTEKEISVNKQHAKKEEE